jgi:hypothetical protein
MVGLFFFPRSHGAASHALTELMDKTDTLSNNSLADPLLLGGQLDRSLQHNTGGSAMKPCIKPITAAAMLAFGVAQGNAITVYIYTDQTAWEDALGGPFLVEEFADSELNAGVTFVSTASGHINPAQECYQDVLASQSQPGPMTIWRFSPSLVGFGGRWTLGGPGGSGNNLQVYIDDLAVHVGNISNSYNGEFLGFISDTPFTSVKLVGGTGSNQQNYSLDDMVYSSAALICPADYDGNGGVDGGDLAAFFSDFEAGEMSADVDQNGGVDGGDLAYFFAVFEAGGCD